MSLRIIALGWVVLLAHCASPAPSKVTPAESERALKNVRRDLARSREALRLHPGRDGLEAVQVVSGFRHATIVTRSADGTRKARCVNDAAEAEAMLRGVSE